jgi:hypothetical protein
LNRCFLTLEHGVTWNGPDLVASNRCRGENSDEIKEIDFPASIIRRAFD